MHDGFVDAYDTRTGAKRRVPAHWFDHPNLCKGLSKTPRQKAAERARATRPDAQKATPPADTDTPAPPEKGAI
ncbi:hypothetical protein [Occultella kanbiaonis]|uniref:hypothetical protein n=1 Tax=Occultella kanbiaonis TaxID=2675754 RepID=UPI0013D45817|nr:hypothetical protein [Occultella kanbiaonis]